MAPPLLIWSESMENYEEYEEMEGLMNESAYAQIMEWKREFFDIYQVELYDIVFTFRALSYAEYEQIKETVPENEEREEAVCRLTVLDPKIEDWSEEIYGVVPQLLARQIMKSSSLTADSSTEVKLYRSEQKMKVKDSIEEQIACLIKEAFPEFRLEEILDWSIKKMCWYEARARWIMENLRGMSFEENELEETIEQQKAMSQKQMQQG